MTESAEPSFPDEQLSTLFALAGLALDETRLASKQELYSRTLALVHRTSGAHLGETIPASSFNASWT
ncbi:hypothetical protein [Rhodococcus sp. NPDC057529]|uniref:hypothetical protein n=1 Tax=Rhodococcus sp. NPDC057529 TaxID=3346158 RepID=UPI0036719698